MPLKIRQKSDSCLIFLIFGVVALYACTYPQNEISLLSTVVDDEKYKTLCLSVQLYIQ